MKEASDFHLIESQHEHFIDAGIEPSLFEEEKVAYNFQDDFHKEHQQNSIACTPKSRRGRKFSFKPNPEEHSALKIGKIKQKKYKVQTQNKQKNPNQMFGHWSMEQNKRYHWFLQIHHSHFMNRSLRRMDRIFTSMAKFVNTREAQQCRSHHQKMQKKHKTFARILLSLRMSYYNNYSITPLKQEIQRNDVIIIEPLLSQQFLIENPVAKQSIFGDLNDPKDEQKSSHRSQQHQQKPNKPMQPVFNPIAPIDMIEQVLAPEVQSSKNYYKFLAHSLDQRNNILDDGYESNLPFNGFF